MQKRSPHLFTIAVAKKLQKLNIKYSAASDTLPMLPKPRSSRTYAAKFCAVLKTQNRSMKPVDMIKSFPRLPPFFFSSFCSIVYVLPFLDHLN